MRAARTHAGTAVVDATLYWFVVATEAEAGYLTTLLNANCLRRAFAESKESGRDFHLHSWRKVPIPSYDKRNNRHRELADLCGPVEKNSGAADSGGVGAQTESRPAGLVEGCA